MIMSSWSNSNSRRSCLSFPTIVALLVLVLLLQLGQVQARLGGGSSKPTKKTPPVWPPLLTAQLLQNRGGNLSDTTLAYDLPNGRNLNIIKDRQTGLTLWDNERGNGSTYYYHKQPEVESCQALNMHVGLLKPDWLAGARYKGVEDVNGHQCDVWAQSSSIHHPFVTYFADVETQRPWRWIFFDGAIFDVIEWTPGGTLPEADWQLPAYCFGEDGVDQVHLEEQRQKVRLSMA
ncbi:transferase-like protein [Nannochloropsis oceanica]